MPHFFSSDSVVLFDSVVLVADSFFCGDSRVDAGRSILVEGDGLFLLFSMTGVGFDEGIEEGWEEGLESDASVVGEMVFPK